MPLKLETSAKLGYNYEKDEFVDVPAQIVVLEHCLLAVARWESKWKVSFFKDQETWTPSMIRSYIQCMDLDDSADPNFVICLNNEQEHEIMDYIKDEKTATTVTHFKKAPASGETLTSELLYYYMAQVPLPFDVCERWHLSRLLKTLEIASVKNDPEATKKMPANMWREKQRALNAARRKQFKSKG
jgi:hypothetical protein